jgi:hypothetical protein
MALLGAAGAALAAATPAYAANPPTLHGFCSSANPCTDNQTNTPTNENPPKFGFWSSPGPSSGTLLVDILVPDNTSLAPNYTISGYLSGTANLVSGPAWTSGDLAHYLGLPDSGSNKTTPSNPLDAFLPATQDLDSGATGFYVFQAIITGVTLPKAGSDAYLSELNLDLAPGSYIVGFLKQCTRGVCKYGATASSAAILETGAVPEPATWALMLVGFAGVGAAMRRTRKRQAELSQLA